MRLSAYLDREDPNPDEVSRHLAGCEACRAWLEAVRADRETMLQAFAPEPSPAFCECVMAGVRQVERARERTKARMGRWTALHRWTEIGAAAAVVALLVGLVAPVVSEARAQARGRQCLANVHEVAAATLVYATDYAETLPPANGWDMRLNSYVRGIGAFQCPESMALPSFFYGPRIGGTRLASYAQPSMSVLLYDEHERSAGVFAPRHAGLGSVGFLDGRATLLSELPNGSTDSAWPVGG